MHSTPVSFAYLHFLFTKPGKENICKRISQSQCHSNPDSRLTSNGFRGYSPAPYTLHAIIHSCPKHHTYHCAAFVLDNWPAARSCCGEWCEKEMREGIICARLPAGILYKFVSYISRGVTYLCFTTCEVAISKYFPFLPFPPCITYPRDPSSVVRFLVSDKMCSYLCTPTHWIRGHRKSVQPTRRN